MTAKKGVFKKITFGFIGIVSLFIFIVIANLIIVNKTGSVISKGLPIADYSGPQSALLVIDIQEATTGDLSLYPYYRENSDILIRNINQVIDSFGILRVPIIYVRSEITNPLINLINNSYAKNSHGARNDKRLKVFSKMEIVKNGKDSFRNTELDSILVRNKVNELFIVGLDAAECVNATVEAAQNRKYKVNLIENAVISKSKELTDSMLICFRNRGVTIIQFKTLEAIH